MRPFPSLALLAALACFACGGGSANVPENYRPPAAPIFSPMQPAPPIPQERKPPPQAPQELLSYQVQPAAEPQRERPAGQPGPPAEGESREGFDQLGSEGQPPGGGVREPAEGSEPPKPKEPRPGTRGGGERGSPPFEQK